MIAILPMGSTEPHGPHLPLDTDSILAMERARRAALLLKERGVEAVILPLVPYGISRLAQDLISGPEGPLTFRVEDGKIFDVETGSEWNLSGRVVDGLLGGASLEIHAEAMVSFWFAWSAFHPSTEIWTQ